MKKYAINIFLIILLVIANSNYLFAQRIMVTIAGTGNPSFNGDGLGSKETMLNKPNDVCMDAAKNVYIADEVNHRIRRVSPQKGIITTIAGGGYSLADGVPATSAFLSPKYMCIDASGNLYVTTLSNNIRKIDAATGLIKTLAGASFSLGYGGDGGPATAARLNSPMAICIDTVGNIYFVDNGNHRVRKISTTGVITTIAGNGTAGYSGDGGPATAATINNSYAISVDNLGRVFFSDQGGTYIRRVDPVTGIISHFAGNGLPVSDAHGAPASTAALGEIAGIHLDLNGDFYLDDWSCSCTRIDHSSGNIYLEAGSHDSDGYTGNGRAATAELLNGPGGLWVDEDGSILIADCSNNRIRKAINVTHVPRFAFGQRQSAFLCAAATPFLIDSLLSITDLDSGQIETWTILAAPVHGTLSGFSANSVCIGKHGVTEPSGTYYVPGPSYTGQDSFRVQVSDGIYFDSLTLYISVQTLLPAGIGGGDHACLGNYLPLSSTIPGGVWSASNSHVTIGSTSGAVIPVSPGLDTITYTAGGTCPAISKQVLLIDTLDITGSILAPDSVCLGASVTLTDAYSGGKWDASYYGIATIDSITGTLTGISIGTVNITYSVSDEFCSSSDTHYVPIRTPSSLLAGTISGPDSVCTGATIALMDPVSGGLWSRCTSAALVDSLTGVVTGNWSGNDTIVYTVWPSPGCHASKRFPVTVVAAPYPGTIIGPDSVCLGATVTLGYTGWSGGIWSARNADAAISSTGILSGILAGTDTIFYSVTNVICTAAASHVIQVNSPLSAGPIYGPDSVCAGAAVTLLDGSSGGVWSLTNTHASISGTGVVSGLSPGPDSVHYSVSNACGTATATRLITISPLPYAGTIAGTSSVCTGASIILTDGAGGGVWSVTNSNASVSAYGVVSGLTPGIDSVQYSVTNTCGTAFTIHEIVIDNCYSTSSHISSAAPAINVFPNPAASALKIEWTDLQPGNAGITITDVAGRVVLDKVLVNDKGSGVTQIDIAGLTDGVYLLVITSGSIHFTDKLVVSK